jgi:hypothetical protein
VDEDDEDEGDEGEPKEVVYVAVLRGKTQTDLGGVFMKAQYLDTIDGDFAGCWKLLTGCQKEL